MDVEKITYYGKLIAEILKKEGNPYLKVEIDSSGIKMTSVDWYQPTTEVAEI